MKLLPMARLWYLLRCVIGAYRARAESSSLRTRGGALRPPSMAMTATPPALSSARLSSRLADLGMSSEDEP